MAQPALAPVLKLADAALVLARNGRELTEEQQAALEKRGPVRTVASGRRAPKSAVQLTLKVSPRLAKTLRAIIDANPKETYSIEEMEEAPPRDLEKLPDTPKVVRLTGRTSARSTAPTKARYAISRISASLFRSVVKYIYFGLHSQAYRHGKWNAAMDRGFEAEYKCAHEMIRRIHRLGCALKAMTYRSSPPRTVGVTFAFMYAAHPALVEELLKTLEDRHNNDVNLNNFRSFMMTSHPLAQWKFTIEDTLRRAYAWIHKLPPSKVQHHAALEFFKFPLEPRIPPLKY